MPKNKSLLKFQKILSINEWTKVKKLHDKTEGVPVLLAASVCIYSHSRAQHMRLTLVAHVAIKAWKQPSVYLYIILKNDYVPLLTMYFYYL